jgi:hypothetical protein
MHVQVKDGLACACACIDDGAIAALGKSLLVSDARRHTQEMAEQRFVPLRSFVERFHVVARDDEHMHGRLRVDVTKSQATLVLVNDVSGNFSRNDLTKETAHKISDS